MKFFAAYYSYSLFLALALSLFYFLGFKRKRLLLSRIADKNSLKYLLSSLDKKKQKIKAVCIILAVTLNLLALMRPQWGFHWQEIKGKGIDIMIALDTSKSMLSEDIKPSRLERAKLAIGDFVKVLKGDRIGFLAFSGKAFLQCPLTVDYGGFLLALDSIDVNSIPKGGTVISSAIREALRGFGPGEKKYKVLLIITDGEDHQGDVLEAAQEAKKEDIVIFCIGIGTKEGELIPITSESGQREFLKDRQGNVVKSRLDETTLQKIAFVTGGSYARSTSAEFGLELIYRQKLSKMEKRELEGKMNKRYEERFQIPLILALLTLLIEPWITDRKRV